MNVPQPDATGTAPEPTGGDAIRALARMEERMVRLAFWQTLLSLAGAAIAIVALYAALVESAEVRRQTAAAVWPFVQVRVSDFDTGQEARFALAFTNAGVGPAKVRDLRLEVLGGPRTDWNAAVAALVPDDAPTFSRDYIGHRVLSPGETVEIFSTTDPRLVRRLQAAVADGSARLSYCYCSIFDECFLADSGDPLREPPAVAACPDFGASAFRG